MPLPSSPHWVPTTTVAGTRLLSCGSSSAPTCRGIRALAWPAAARCRRRPAIARCADHAGAATPGAAAARRRGAPGGESPPATGAGVTGRSERAAACGRHRAAPAAPRPAARAGLGLRLGGVVGDVSVAGGGRGGASAGPSSSGRRSSGGELRLVRLLGAGAPSSPAPRPLGAAVVSVSVGAVVSAVVSVGVSCREPPASTADRSGRAPSLPPDRLGPRLIASSSRARRSGTRSIRRDGRGRASVLRITTMPNAADGPAPAAGRRRSIPARSCDLDGRSEGVRLRHLGGRGLSYAVRRRSRKSLRRRRVGPE